jgi:hypothetical protein
MIYLFNSSKHVTRLSANTLRSVCFDTLLTAVSLSLVAVQIRCVAICSDRLFTAVSRSLVVHQLRRRRFMFWCSAPSDSPPPTREHGARGCQWK